MQSSTLLLVMAEAAARSLALAAVVGLGLLLLRTRNVVAQKTAWLLVLLGSLAMPALAPWAAHVPRLASAATILVPQIKTAESVKPVVLAPSREVVLPDESAVGEPTAAAQSFVKPAASAAVSENTAAHFPAPTVTVGQLSAAPPVAEPSAAQKVRLDPADMALLVYFSVCAILLIRLAMGLVAAFTLWRNADPVDIAFPVTRVRLSRNVASPVTIGSGIVLPEDALGWDAEKLRIVLAHEASHVRQGDFFLQALCSIYSAVFWFSPLGWWMKRKLSDLSETISDGAAVSQAASHVSYAQVLLEFAAMPRPLPIGVAMASHGRVASRIEHLLNESRFRQAFAGGRARLICAVVLVPLALCATALVRVQAASHQTPQPATAPTPQTPAPAPAPQTTTPATASQAPAPATAPASPDSQAPAPAAPSNGADVAPPAPAQPAVPGTPDVAPPPPPSDDQGSGNGSGAGADGARTWTITSAQTDSNAKGTRHRGTSFNSYGKGYAYSYHSNGDSYAIISGKNSNITFSGDWYEGRKAELDKARSMAHGDDFLWFTRDGKSYMLDDPTVVAQLREMYKPMEELGRQQEALGKQQEELGRQQEELGRKQERASVPTPDMTKQMAAVEKAVAELKAAKGQMITQEKLADMQEKLADLMGKLGELQGEVGSKQGEFGAQQGKLGEMQGRLGAQQGKLGSEQGRLAMEADKKVRSVIDESLKNGKAKPVE